MNANNGTLYGVGVGPGDPELITLKAARLIASASLIAYPAAENEPSLARRIAEGLIPANTPELAISMPIGVSRFPVANIYDEAAQRIGSHLSQGEDVVVLCEGDPFFYGSFMYLFSRLSERYMAQVVPGVSSLMTGGALSLRPLASLNETFAVAPSPLPAPQLTQLLAMHDNLVFLKLGRHLQKVRQVIEAAGLLSHAWYMERLCLPNQKILPLDKLTVDTAPYFSLIQVNKRKAAPR